MDQIDILNLTDRDATGTGSFPVIGREISLPSLSTVNISTLVRTYHCFSKFLA